MCELDWTKQKYHVTQNQTKERWKS